MSKGSARRRSQPDVGARVSRSRVTDGDANELGRVPAGERAHRPPTDRGSATLARLFIDAARAMSDQLGQPHVALAENRIS